MKTTSDRREPRNTKSRISKQTLRRHLSHKRWAWPRRQAFRWAFGPIIIIKAQGQSKTKLKIGQQQKYPTICLLNLAWHPVVTQHYRLWLHLGQQHKSPGGQRACLCRAMTALSRIEKVIIYPGSFCFWSPLHHEETWQDQYHCLCSCLFLAPHSRGTIAHGSCCQY